MKDEVDIFYLITGLLDLGICIAVLGTHAWNHNVWEPFASLPEIVAFGFACALQQASNILRQIGKESCR